MRAGSMRERVRFEKRIKGSNVGGVVRGRWIRLCGPVAARIIPVGGGEAATADRLTGHQTYEISVRDSAATRQVLADHRVVDDRDPTRIFKIVAPARNPDEKREELRFTCQIGPTVA